MYVGLSGAFLVNIETVSYIKGIRFRYFDNWNGKIMSLWIVFTKRLSSYLENILSSAKGWNKLNPIPKGGDIFTPPNKFSKYLKNCACRWPALFYMWLNISFRHPVKISAWYKYKNCFYDISQKDGWHYILKIGSKQKNIQNVNSNNFRVVNDRHLIFSQ